jgi:hypothetical protein
VNLSPNGRFVAVVHKLFNDSCRDPTFAASVTERQFSSLKYAAVYAVSHDGPAAVDRVGEALVELSQLVVVRGAHVRRLAEPLPSARS